MYLKTHSVCIFSLRNYKREEKQHLIPRSESIRTGERRMFPCCRCGAFQESRLIYSTNPCWIITAQPSQKQMTLTDPERSQSQIPHPSLAFNRRNPSDAGRAEVCFLSFMCLTSTQTHRAELHASSQIPKDLEKDDSYEKNISHRSRDFQEFALVESVQQTRLLPMRNVWVHFEISDFLIVGFLANLSTVWDILRSLVKLGVKQHTLVKMYQW